MTAASSPAATRPRPSASRWAIPYFKVKPQLARHGVAVFSSNYTLYGDMSQRVVQTLEQLAPSVEVYSIDEAFLDLGGFADDAVLALAAHIRRTVKAWTGIPVSVGIGPTKTLAKAANRVAKKHPDASGVWSLITPSSQHEALVAASRRRRVGHRQAMGQTARSRRHHHRPGIQPASRTSWLKKHLNVVGLRTAWELRGIPCIPLELAPPPRKGLMVSRSFGRRITEFEPLREALAAYVTRAGEKLRRERRHARQMMIFVHNSPFDAKRSLLQPPGELPAPAPDQRHRRADPSRLPRPSPACTAPASVTANAASCSPS